MTGAGDKNIGLALGGGAARGIAHIPLLEALDELGVKPGIIAGASIGALVGAGYASGLSGKDIRKHTLDVLGNRVEAARRLFQGGSNPFELINISLRAPVKLDGTRLASVVLPENVAENVEDTDIALVISATDFYASAEVAITSGPLQSAVAASMAIPGIIEAPAIQGRLMIDGAMCNPVPFDHVTGEGRIVVAIDVTGHPLERKGRKPGYSDFAFGSTQIMQRRMSELARAIAPPDVYIEPDIARFRAHDFFKVRDILKAGDAIKDSFKRQLERVLDSEVVQGS